MRRRLVTTIMSDITLKEGLDLFVTDRKMMNLAERSIIDYVKFFQYFLNYINDDDFKCRDVDEALYLGYITHMQETKPHLSKQTVKTYLTHVRTVLYFLMDTGKVKSFNCKMIKAPKAVKETYKPYNLDKLLEKPDFNTCTFCHARNWAITCYFLSTGNRADTLINIKLGDIDFRNEEIHLRATKNKKERIQIMSDYLKKVLTQYLDFPVNRSKGADDYLFCSVYGSQLTSGGLDSAVGYYLAKCGVDETGIHKFRHTFSTEFLRNGGTPQELQRLLDHSTIDMTMEYVHMTQTDLRKNYSDHNPLDNLMKSKKQGNYLRPVRK